jgi:hypothetical protein
MESVATHAATRSSLSLRRIDGNALIIWALVGSLVLYLGFDGGGYDVVVSSQVGVIVWWVVLIGAICGLLLPSRISRTGWVALGAFAAFAAWTALATSWSISSERSLQELSRVATYLGVLLLGIALNRDRERGLRHTVNALSAAILTIGALALASRLLPASFPASRVTADFLGGSRDRLAWPLNYWNGLAALLALGLPLLLSVATSAKTLRVQAAAAAGLPVLALSAYLTFSRGGAVEIAVAVVAFIAFTPDRLPKLATMLVAAGGSAMLIAGALHRHAVENGLTNHLATVQGRQLVVATIVVCVGVGVAQLGIGNAARHGTLPRWLRISPPRARVLLGAAVVVCIVVGIAVHGPSRLSHAWTSFKNDQGATAVNTPASHYGALSGDGRYTYWKIALKASANRRLQGTGPGTFQLLYLPRAKAPGPVVNAHSLYVETLAEVGVVGLALLVVVFATLLFAAVRLVVRSEHETRCRAAAALAGLLAFMVAACVDWVWQLPVIPVAFLLLGAAVLAPARASGSVRQASRRVAQLALPSRRGRAIVVGAVILLAAAALVAIDVPLASTSDVQQSQNAAARGDLSAALSDARSAVHVEPGAASAQAQLALVQELRRDLPAALGAATSAVHDESDNWSYWLILSRIQAESDEPGASVASYRRARSLNPYSRLFQS